MVTTITWNDATEVVSVYMWGDLLVENIDYEVINNNRTATLTIFESFFTDFDPNVGDPAELTVMVINSTPPT